MSTVESIVGLVLAIAAIAYPVYALIAPERI